MVWIRENKTQNSIETEMRAMLKLLAEFGTPHCIKNGRPKDLMCQLALPHCSVDSDGVEHYDQMCPAQCSIAAQKYCQYEFMAARSAVYMDPVMFGIFDMPECNSLPLESDKIYSCGDYEQNRTDITEEPDIAAVVSCPAPLVPSASDHISCSPECGTWSWTTLSSSDAIEICTWVGFIVGIMAAGVVFFTWASCRSMWKFPDILVLYINVCGTVACLVIGIALTMGKKRAYCSANDWATAFEKPTAFCAVQGAIYHYVTIALYLWWMFLLVNKTFTILCERTATFMAKHSKLIHLIELAIGWVVPGVLVGTVFWSGDKNYGLQSTDPLTCGPTDLNTAYYTMSLPMQIIFGTALTVVIFFHAIKDCKPTLIVWSGCQVKRIVAKPVGRLEKRYLILITAYPLMCLLVFLPGISMMQHAKKLECSLIEYFVCMTLPEPRPQCEPNFRNYIYPQLFCVAALSTGISCYALVFFASLSKEARTCWRHHKDNFLAYINVVKMKLLCVPCDPSNQCDPVRNKNKEQVVSSEMDMSESIGARYASLRDWKPPHSTAL